MTVGPQGKMQTAKELSEIHQSFKSMIRVHCA